MVNSAGWRLPCRSGPLVDGPKDPWPGVLSLPGRFVGDPTSLARDNIYGYLAKSCKYRYINIKESLVKTERAMCKGNAVRCSFSFHLAVEKKNLIHLTV